MKYILVLVLIALQGCATAPKAVVTPEKVAVDSYILEAADPLLVPTVEDFKNPGKFLVLTSKNTLIHKSCVNRLTAAQAVIRRFSNNP